MANADSTAPAIDIEAVSDLMNHAHSAFHELRAMARGALSLLDGAEEGENPDLTTRENIACATTLLIRMEERAIDLAEATGWTSISDIKGRH